MGYGFGQNHGSWSDVDAGGPPGTQPGKRTLTGSLPARPAWAATERPAATVVQADGGGAMEDPFAVHLIASRGVAGSGSALPHQAAIQQSFGHHDVSGVKAHVGGAAAEASEAIGARAYATGDSVAFSSAPDLRQAAHEAAHVVQQRGGVRLDGGVGRAGDPYEQHADAVADAVVRGESAEALLDPMAHRGAAGGPAVQRLVELSDGAATSRLRALIHAGNASDLSNIRAELGRALGNIASGQLRAGVDVIVAGQEYRLEIPITDLRALAAEAASARPVTAAARDRALEGAAPAAPEPEAHHVGGAVEGGVEFVDTGDVPTPGFGNVRMKGRVIGAVSAPSPEAGHAEGGPSVHEAPRGHITGVETEVAGGRTSAHHAEWEAGETGILRDWLMPDCTMLADRFNVSINHDTYQLVAGLRTGTLHVGPFNFNLAFDLLRVEGSRTRLALPHVQPPSVTLTSELPAGEIWDMLPAAIRERGIDLNLRACRLSVDLTWTPPWADIARDLGLMADATAAATTATTFTTATSAADMLAADSAASGLTAATASGTAGAIGVGVAVPLLAGVVIVGGTLMAMADAAAEGEREGLLTWYVHEYAAQFADICFNNHEGHATGAHGTAARFAGEGRREAREAAHRLGRDQLDALRVEYRSHSALAHALAQVVARRVGAPDIYYEMR